MRRDPVRGAFFYKYEANHYEWNPDGFAGGLFMLREHTFDTGVVSINYAEGPSSGPPLLLLHEFTSRWQSLLPIISDLSMRWHIYAPDFRGHGRSGRVHGHYRLKDHFSDTKTFIEQVIKEPTVVFGKSMGGWIATMLAAQLPDLVRAIVIGDSPPNFQGSYRERLKRMKSVWVGFREIAELEGSIEELVQACEDIEALWPWGKEESITILAVAKSLSLLDPDAITLWVKGCDDIDAFQSLFDGCDSSLLFPAISCQFFSYGETPL